MTERKWTRADGCCVVIFTHPETGEREQGYVTVIYGENPRCVVVEDRDEKAWWIDVDDLHTEAVQNMIA